jgi:streptomycin 6-kinase
VERLPAPARAVLEEWELEQDGPARHGSASLVLPVRTRGGRPATLKLGSADEQPSESEHEHLALQHWHGNGSAQLLRADPRRRALLLERLHEEDLTELWDLEACEVVAGLYAALHVPAPPQLRTLSSLLVGWAARLAALPRGAPVPRRIVEQALLVAEGFRTDAGTDGVLVHTDLHSLHVLAADRAPWLAIAPRPLSGDPHFEPAPMLGNRWEEVVASGDVRDAVRRRFHTLVDVAGLDEHRARDWVVLRETMDAVRALEDAEPDRKRVTRSITIAKAVQD